MRPAVLPAALMALTILTGALCLAAPALADDTAAHAAPHWTYNGKDGPAHWGELEKDYATCKTGRHQSPIDLKPKTAPA